MVKNLYKFCLSLFFVFLSCSSNPKDEKWNVTDYLKTNFGVTVSSETQIRFHTYKDVELRCSKLPVSDSEKKDALLSLWSTKIDTFIDSVYTKDNNGEYHGIYINFPGDSTGGYRLRYYKHGVKDSVWITKMANGSEKIESYLNGRMHGIWVGKDSYGNKSYYKKFNSGIPIDTAYDLWPNGNLMQMEIFQDGKLAKKSCFDDDGKTETECE